MMTTHNDLIDAVNDAETLEEHERARAYLYGWRAGIRHCGQDWSGIAADIHTMRRFGDRPTCCGELLDWSPE